MGITLNFIHLLQKQPRELSFGSTWSSGDCGAQEAITLCSVTHWYWESKTKSQIWAFRFNRKILFLLLFPSVFSQTFCCMKCLSFLPVKPQGNVGQTMIKESVHDLLVSSMILKGNPSWFGKKIQTHCFDKKGKTLPRGEVIVYSNCWIRVDWQ